MKDNDTKLLEEAYSQVQQAPKDPIVFIPMGTRGEIEDIILYDDMIEDELGGEMPEEAVVYDASQGVAAALQQYYGGYGVKSIHPDIEDRILDNHKAHVVGDADGSVRLTEEEQYWHEVLANGRESDDPRFDPALR